MTTYNAKDYQLLKISGTGIQRFQATGHFFNVVNIPDNVVLQVGFGEVVDVDKLFTVNPGATIEFKEPFRNFTINKLGAGTIEILISDQEINVDVKSNKVVIGALGSQAYAQEQARLIAVQNDALIGEKLLDIDRYVRVPVSFPKVFTNTARLNFQDAELNIISGGWGGTAAESPSPRPSPGWDSVGIGAVTNLYARTFRFLAPLQNVLPVIPEGVTGLFIKWMYVKLSPWYIVNRIVRGNSANVTLAICNDPVPIPSPSPPGFFNNPTTVLVLREFQATVTKIPSEVNSLSLDDIVDSFFVNPFLTAPDTNLQNSTDLLINAKDEAIYFRENSAYVPGTTDMPLLMIANSYPLSQVGRSGVQAIQYPSIDVNMGWYWLFD